jgi:2'-5' RNA ligase
MYFWVAASLPNQSEKRIRNICIPLMREKNISNMAFLLGQHISLKMPFASDDVEAVMDFLNSYLQKKKPFYVETDKVEKHGTICWLRFKPSEDLQKIHDDLVDGLYDIFQLFPHELDKSFVFHSSIAIDKDTNKIDWLYDHIKNCFQDRHVLISSFIIGTSQSGESGTWKEMRKIQLEDLTESTLHQLHRDRPDGD